MKKNCKKHRKWEYIFVFKYLESCSYSKPILPTVMNRYSANLIKLQQLFFLEIGIKWNLKRPQRPEEVLSNKHKDKGIMLPDLKIDHKAIGAISTTLTLKKKRRHINQGSRRSGPERNRSVCFALTDWPSSAQNIQWRKYGLFKTCYWETQMLAC